MIGEKYELIWVVRVCRRKRRRQASSSQRKGKERKWRKVERRTKQTRINRRGQLTTNRIESSREGLDSKSEDVYSYMLCECMYVCMYGCNVCSVLVGVSRLVSFPSRFRLFSFCLPFFAFAFAFCFPFLSLAAVLRSVSFRPSAIPFQRADHERSDEDKRRERRTRER